MSRIKFGCGLTPCNSSTKMQVMSKPCKVQSNTDIEKIWKEYAQICKIMNVKRDQERQLKGGFVTKHDQLLVTNMQNCRKKTTNNEVHL